MTLERKTAKLLEKAKAALSAQTPDRLLELDSSAKDMSADIREEIQAKTLPSVRAVIEKLKARTPLQAEEKEMVKLWIAGDAAAYRRENDLKNWLGELQRLCNETAKLSGRALTAQELNDLWGTLDDMRGLVPLLQKYREQAERVARLERALKNFNPADTDFIVGVLERKINSQNN